MLNIILHLLHLHYDLAISILKGIYHSLFHMIRYILPLLLLTTLTWCIQQSTPPELPSAWEVTAIIDETIEENQEIGDNEIAEETDSTTQKTTTEKKNIEKVAPDEIIIEEPDEEEVWEIVKESALTETTEVVENEANENPEESESIDEEQALNDIEKLLEEIVEAAKEGN